MNTTFRQLRYFVALADAGNFTLAAELANVTQPALSLQIKELEANLGVKLVERMPREIRLTRAGQDVLARARVILTEVRDLEASARLRGGLSGSLTLGAIPTIAPYLLPHVLTRLRSADISLELKVREAQTHRLVDALQKGEIDAAVIALPIDLHGLEVTKLFSDRFLLAGSKSRIASYTETAPPNPTDLPSGSLLLLEDGHCLSDQTLAVCGLKGRRQAVDLSASSLSTLCGLVGQGFGLTLLPEMAVNAESAATPDMGVMRFPDPQPERTIALVRRKSTENDGWFSDLADLIGEAGRELLTTACSRIAA